MKKSTLGLHGKRTFKEMGLQQGSQLEKDKHLGTKTKESTIKGRQGSTGGKL